MNDRETARDLSKRLEKAYEEIARLKEALEGCLRTYCTPIYSDERKAQEVARTALKEDTP